METNNRTIKCEECGGQGYFIEDFNDPNDNNGHGQREEKCLDCGGTGGLFNPVVALWAMVKTRYFTKTQQERVRSRVLDGMGLDRALRSEGIIIPAINGDLSAAKKMFENGLLAVDEIECGISRETDTVISSEEMPDCNIDTALKVEVTAEEFIPRPKNN